MFIYPVTLTPDETDGGFTVTFVDIPEAITQGDTEAEALAAAKDALESALDFYFEDKRTVPAPSQAKKGQHVVELPASLSAKVIPSTGAGSRAEPPPEIRHRQRSAGPSAATSRRISWAPAAAAWVGSLTPGGRAP